MNMTDCAFCRIVAKLEPAEVIYETEHTLAFFPLEPATSGHTLVIPKRHVETFLDVRPNEIPEIGRTVLTVGRALRAVIKPEGMNLISSAGEAASQSIMHMHIHLVPRWSGDEVGEIWPPKIPTPKRKLELDADAIREFCRTEALEDRNPE
ncbi:MAG: HIT family protein [Thermomicrobiales bacterium]